MAAEAARMAAVAAKRCKTDKRRGLVQWAVTGMDNHARTAHAFCKGTEFTTELYDAPVTTTKGDICCYVTPDEAVAQRAAPWHKLWSRDDAALSALRDKFKDMRNVYLAG